MKSRIPKTLRILLIIIAICDTTFVYAQNNNENVRVNQLFNFGWKFKSGYIPNAQNVAFDDNDWCKLDLPHWFSDCYTNFTQSFATLHTSTYK